VTPLLGADAFRAGCARRLLGLPRLPAPRRLQAIVAVVLRIRADSRLHGPQLWSWWKLLEAGGTCGKSWCIVVYRGLDQGILRDSSNLNFNEWSMLPHLATNKYQQFIRMSCESATCLAKAT